MFPVHLNPVPYLEGLNPFIISIIINHKVCLGVVHVHSELTMSVMSWLTYSKKQYPFEKVVPLSLTKLNALSSPKDESSSFTYKEPERGG